MSFVDPDRPKNTKFLGALIIEANDEFQLLPKSHSLGLNPGGEIQFFKIPKELEYRIPQEWIDRKLISRDECEALEKKWQ
jgi:hypothetical protein